MLSPHDNYYFYDSARGEEAFIGLKLPFTCHQFSAYYRKLRIYKKVFILYFCNEFHSLNAVHCLKIFLLGICRYILKIFFVDIL